MNQKIWEIQPKIADDLVEQLLANRGVKLSEKCKFLSPQYSDLVNPQKIDGIGKAVSVILAAASGNQKVGIFADYDADGATSAALLFEALKKLGILATLYIPTRQEGYGLNQKALQIFKKRGIDLIFILDSGIRNVAEIKLARKLGFKVVVIDHHECGRVLPPAEVVIDPKKQKTADNLDILSTGGLVFKLIQAVRSKSSKIGESFEKWSLDLVAISTISDIVPLLAENRILTKYGLIVLQKTRRAGLKSLYQIAQIDPKNINTYVVGFQIGPRINAPGRMNQATSSFYLLTTQNPQEAKELARKLNEINVERQNTLDQVLREAKKRLKEKKIDKNKVLLIDGQGWPEGVIGLVAGKLMEKYARPVLVASRKGDWLRGSARSIDGYHLVEAFDGAKDLLTTYGGHARAAGFSLEVKHLENLYDRLLDIAEVKLKDQKLLPKLYLDVEIEPREINWKTLKLINQFEPFGLGNPRPTFCLPKIQFASYRTCGRENKHLKGLLKTENGLNFSFIGFDLGWWGRLIKTEKFYDVAFYIDENYWNGERFLELRLIDIRNAGHKY